jgi:inner membrane protein
MDNLTHSLLGATLAKTPLGRASPFAPAALVIAANLPDLENLVLAFCDKPTNMIHHRSVTHAVLGVVILAPLFAVLVWGLARRFRRAAPSGSFWMLLLGVGLATASHPVLDWLNTYGVRPWLPFDGTWVHGDLVYIVDPWLWLLLGGAVCLAGRRRRGGSIVLGILGGITTAIVLFSSPLTPWVLQPAWLLAVAALAFGRWRGWGARHAAGTVGVALGLAVAYVGFLGWAGRQAWHMSAPIIVAQLPPGETIIAHTLSPQPADPLRWEIVAETQDAVYRHGFSILGPAGGAVRLRKRLDDPLVRRVADSPEGRAWRIFARHPVAMIARHGSGRRVYLLDARYSVLSGRGFASFAIDVSASPPVRTLYDDDPR